MIYHKEGYDNEIDPFVGNWKGKTLPDGTYFYVLDLGNKKTLSGYLMIHR